MYLLFEVNLFFKTVDSLLFLEVDVADDFIIYLQKSLEQSKKFLQILRL